MVSDLFKKDYRQMTAQGVTFTPEDIIRLNALAVKVTRAQNAAGTVHLPRVAFLGKLTLREPSIAHDLWIEEASRWIDCRDDRAFLWLHGYALSHAADELVDATKPRKVFNAVFTFAAKCLCGFTDRQLRAAVEYALVGNDWTVGETAPEKEPDSRTEQSPTLGLLVEAKAMKIWITADEAKRMTAGDLEESIARALIIEKRFEFADATKKALADYFTAREEIKKRFNSPTEDSRKANDPEKQE